MSDREGANLRLTGWAAVAMLAFLTVSFVALVATPGGRPVSPAAVPAPFKETAGELADRLRGELAACESELTFLRTAQPPDWERAVDGLVTRKAGLKYRLANLATADK